MNSRRFARISLSFLLVSGLVAGELRVNIINGTTNTAGYADRVALMDLSTGMNEVAAVTNVNGSTTFSDVQSGGQSQYMIQASFAGVSYSTMLVPEAELTVWETSVTVYDTKAIVSDITVSVPFYVIYSFTDKLYIQKRLVLENHSNPPVVFIDSPGIINVHIPEDVSEFDYMTFKNSNMPLKTEAVNSENGLVIPNAVKPGNSEIDMAYYLPYESEKATLIEQVDYDIEHFHVYVMPASMTITAAGLRREGTDSENNLAIYAVNNVKAGTAIEFKLSGTGMSETESQTPQENTGRIVVEHRIDTSVALVLAGVIVLFILGALFFAIAQQNTDLKQESIDLLKQQKKELLQKYGQSTGSPEDEVEKNKIFQRLFSIYKTLDRIK